MPAAFRHRPRTVQILETAIGFFTRGVAARIERFRASVRLRKTIMEVSDLSDDHLVDIGLTREAIRIAELTGRLPRVIEEALDRDRG